MTGMLRSLGSSLEKQLRFCKTGFVFRISRIMCYTSHRQQDYFAGRSNISAFVFCGFSEGLLTSVELLYKSLH